MIVVSPPADADRVDGGPPEPDSATFASLGEPDSAADGAMSSDGAAPAVSDGAGPAVNDGAGPAVSDGAGPAVNDGAGQSVSDGRCGAGADTCCTMSSGQDACASSSLPQCTGGACMCIAGCSGGIIELSDGTLWYGTVEYGQTPYGTTGAGMTELTSQGTTPFVALTSANSFSVFSEAFSQFAFGYGCAVQRGGTVWCWGGNSYGALGEGIAMLPSSTFPVQVQTAIGGPALENITKVFVDHATGLGACAIDASGEVWCWGDGYNGTLGNGVQSASPVATPVLQSGTTGSQFAGLPRCRFPPTTSAPSRPMAPSGAGATTITDRLVSDRPPPSCI